MFHEFSHVSPVFFCVFFFLFARLFCSLYPVFSFDPCVFKILPYSTLYASNTNEKEREKTTPAPPTHAPLLPVSAAKDVMEKEVAEGACTTQGGKGGRREHVNVVPIM